MAKESKVLAPLQVGQAKWNYEQFTPWTPHSTFSYPAPASKEDYANRVVVERRKHDATIKFFRDGKSTGRPVATVTVPLAVLDAMLEADRG